MSDEWEYTTRQPDLSKKPYQCIGCPKLIPHPGRCISCYTEHNELNRQVQQDSDTYYQQERLNNRNKPL